MFSRYLNIYRETKTQATLIKPNTLLAQTPPIFSDHQRLLFSLISFTLTSMSWEEYEVLLHGAEGSSTHLSVPTPDTDPHVKMSISFPIWVCLTQLPLMPTSPSVFDTPPDSLEHSAPHAYPLALAPGCRAAAPQHCPREAIPAQEAPASLTDGNFPLNWELSLDHPNWC